MVDFPEYIQIRAPAGMTQRLRDVAEREGLKPAQLIRDAIAARLDAASAETRQAA